MTLDLDKYAFTDGVTALSAAELNPRFYGIVRRLHTLELLSIDWDTAIAQVQNYGLARINDAVQPLIDSLKTDLTAVVAQGEAALASQATAVDAKLDDADVQIAGIQAAVASVVAQGEADLASQSAAVNEALLRMAEHEGRHDNPHGVTAEQIRAMALDTSSELSITGATTLNAAFGKMHVCTGTTTDYTVGLPAAAGNAGKLLGIRIGNACNKLVTLDGNASELIDGALTRVMWAGESAILLCDGVGWAKIAGKSIPMICKMAANAVQSIPSGTATAARYDIKEIDNASIGNLSNGIVSIRRAGYYFVVAHASINGIISWQLNLSAQGSVSLTTASSATVASATKSAYFASGATCSAGILQSSGSAVNTASYPYPYLSVQEVVQW